MNEEEQEVSAVLFTDDDDEDLLHDMNISEMNETTADEDDVWFEASDIPVATDSFRLSTLNDTADTWSSSNGHTWDLPALSCNERSISCRGETSQTAVHDPVIQNTNEDDMDVDDYVDTFSVLSAEEEKVGRDLDRAPSNTGVTNKVRQNQIDVLDVSSSSDEERILPHRRKRVKMTKRRFPEVGGRASRNSNVNAWSSCMYPSSKDTFPSAPSTSSAAFEETDDIYYRHCREPRHGRNNARCSRCETSRYSLRNDRHRPHQCDRHHRHSPRISGRSRTNSKERLHHYPGRLQHFDEREKQRSPRKHTTATSSASFRQEAASASMPAMHLDDQMFPGTVAGVTDEELVMIATAIEEADRQENDIDIVHEWRPSAEQASQRPESVAVTHMTSSGDEQCPPVNVSTPVARNLQSSNLTGKSSLSPNDARDAVKLVAQLEADEEYARQLQQQLDMETAQAIAREAAQLDRHDNNELPMALHSHTDAGSPCRRCASNYAVEPLSDDGDDEDEEVFGHVDRFNINVGGLNVVMSGIEGSGLDIFIENPSRHYSRGRSRRRPRGRGGMRIRSSIRGDYINESLTSENYDQLWDLAEELGEVVQRGLTREEINLLPTHSYEERTGVSEEDSTCNICMDRYKGKDKLRMLPCLHNFHMGCIDKWIKNNATCPVCRVEVNLDQ